MKNSIVKFAGVLIGGISLLFIYPLDDEIYGLAQFIYSMAMLLIPFATFGILPSIVKFYPSFKTDDNKNNGFLTAAVLSMLVSLLIFTGAFYLLEETVIRGLAYLNLNVELLVEYKIHILILMVLLGFILLYQSNAQNFKRIVVPQILNGFAFKLALPVLVLIYYWNWINESQYLNLILVFFAVVLVGMIMYTYAQKQLTFARINKPLFKKRRSELLTYSFFSSLSSVGNMVAFRIDTVMVAAMVSLTGTGIYAKILFIASVIDIPVKSINQISSPILSERMESGDMEEVEMIYKKSSINGLLVGGLIFLLIWFSLIDLFEFSGRPESFLNGQWIFLFLGIGKIVDIATSANNQIIIYSKFYKYNIIFILVLAVANIMFNYYFIEEYGVTGAAIATCISLIIYNLIKFLFIWVKFKLIPFTKETLLFIALFILVFAVVYFVPDTSSHLLNMFIKSVIILGIYIPLMIRLKISEDLNEMFRSWISKLKR